MVSCHWQCQTSRLDEKGLESFDLLQVGSGSDSVKFCSITFQSGLAGAGAGTSNMNRTENLTLEIDNMKIQAGMDRWPASKSIQE